MSKIDDALRDAVRDLSDQGRPPADLGPRMVAAGRRLQYRRTAFTAVASVAAVIAVGAPVLAVDTIRDNKVAATKSPTSTPDPSATPEPPTPGPVPFPFPTTNPSPSVNLPTKLVTFDGARLLAGQPMGYAQSVPGFAYSEAKKRYVKVPRLVEANPAGTLAIVKADQNKPWTFGILDLATNKTDWTTLELGVEGSAPFQLMKLQWSPDGSKVLVGLESGKFALYDAASRKLGTWATFDRTHSLVTWHPNGRELLSTKYDGDRPFYDRSGGFGSDAPASTGKPAGTGKPGKSTGPSSEVRVGLPSGPMEEVVPDGETYGAVKSNKVSRLSKPLRLDVLDLTGKKLRSMPITANVLSPAQLSPNGALLIGRKDFGTNFEVIDARTGKTLVKLPAQQEPVMAYETHVWWLDDQHVLLPDWDVNRGKTVIKVYGLDGKLRRTHDLPWYGSGYAPMVLPPAR